MIGLVAEIALEGATFAFDKLYTYLVPPDMQEKAAVGSRVIVPFGKGNLKKQGMILRLARGELKGLKAISALTDREPVLTAEQCALCEYMRETCFCTYFDAVKAMLPTGLNYRLIRFYSAAAASPGLTEEQAAVFAFLEKKGETAEEELLKKTAATPEMLADLLAKGAITAVSDAKRRMGDATMKYVRAAIEEAELEGYRLTPRRREVMELVLREGSAAVKEIEYYTGVSPSVINGLIGQGLLTVFEKQVYRTAATDREPHQTPIRLTEEQQAAFDGLMADYRKQEGAVSLLYGVTGSGKTQVFLRLADEVIAAGRGVIVMVPEISLTPQMLSIFTNRYGCRVAVFHSAMSMGKRLDEWRRVKNGEAAIAIGTRSAIFAPFADLGLIIMDEEQEYTYKSEQAPRFHARDLARFRTARQGGLLCLASATPSVETFTAAKSGKISLFRLKNRYGSAVLPEVETVDMRQEILSGNSSAFSRRLYEAVGETLSRKKQAIILLNRRGHHTYISCPDCGYVATCPHCSISLTYHSANRRLMCHYCGYSVAVSSTCPTCGGEHMKFLGLGTQKAAEELAALFPSARILRVDADSTLARDSYAEYLTSFSKGEADILLGTQMVAKGLDFPNVTLVGVLGADSAAYSEDFRSFERAFSLLTQVVGRAGRGGEKGLAIVQTMDPSGNLVSLAARQDYDSFYEEEIATRKLMIYPPYCDLCMIVARSVAKEAAENAIQEIFLNIKQKLTEEYRDVKVIILGPSAASIPRVNNRYRYRMLIKCRANKRLREMLRASLAVRQRGDVTVGVDFNPETVI